MAGKSPKEEQTVKAFGWAASEAAGVLSPFEFSRRATGEHDVQVKILYCGLCTYDVWMMKNKWGMTNYPYVFGHEAVGMVTEIGSKVRKFKVGDKVGVGSQLGSCGKCERCINDLDQYCPEMIATDGFGSTDASYGACCDVMVAHENFVIVWPENLPPHAGAPLLCAGITTYSPLRNFGLDKPGIHVGVVGLGGLGHVAVRFAKAFGAKVTVISTSANKKQEAIEKYGADSFLVSNEQEQMQAAVGTMNGIIDTSPVTHLLVPLLNLLKPHGKLVLIGAPDKPYELPVAPLLEGGRIVAGSGSGSFRQTQEMIDFAAKHNIVADVEVIPIEYLNTAVERIEKGDVKYRFVIDMGNASKSA